MNLEIKNNMCDMYLLYQKRKKSTYCHVNFLECNLMISFGKKVGKNDDLRWKMSFCLQISPVNILQGEADKDLKYFIIGTRNLQSRIWIFSQE